jgi:hypothetical protein
MAKNRTPQQEAAWDTWAQRKNLEMEIERLDERITELASATARNFKEMAERFSRTRTQEKTIYKHRSTTLFRGGRGPLGDTWLTRELPEAVAQREVALEQLAQVAGFQSEYDGTILDFSVFQEGSNG